MRTRSLAYWEGVATGLFAGLIAGAFLPRLLGSCASREPSAHEVLQALNDAPEKTKSGPFASRRDSPESAGDPAIVGGAAGRSGVEFRRAGAPGPGSDAEQLTMPGQPGQNVDAGRRVRVSTRTLSLGGKTVGKKSAHPKKKSPPHHPAS